MENAMRKVIVTLAAMLVSLPVMAYIPDKGESLVARHIQTAVSA